jgi:hypothetical protein
LIEQILNKQFLQFVLGGLENAAKAPQEEDSRRSEEVPETLDEAETHTLLADLEAARVHAGLTSATGAAVESDRRSIEAAEAPEMSLADRTVFISGSTELSNLQSAIEQHVEERRQDLLMRNEDVIADEDDRRGAEGASFAGARLKGWSEDVADRRLFGPFEQTDLRWINSWFAQAMRKFRGKHAFVPRPIRKEPIAFPDENVRLIVLGDWGSGIPRAQKVSTVIRRELDAGKAAGLQQHVIHLGDVYYSGWEREYRDRLLKDWPVRADEKDTIGSFNLNGNHDMFSGGHAYYEYSLADERFAGWQGKSSLFHLANSRWQLFGLDTAWEDAALKDDQATWVLGAAAAGKKTILLSHHQYCSSYEKISAGVTGPVQPLLKQLDIAAWLWGHEHRCESYREFAGIRAPRCLGHGGVPVYQLHGLDDPLPAPGEWEYRDYVDGGLELWAKFGFVTLDFHGDTIAVRYLNEDGGVDRTETIR